ncbi:MAG: proline--tRNA ligase [Phycisphaerales bacterium]|nr:proline--tRNA ligase [Phycisphaerales bacterium]
MNPTHAANADAASRSAISTSKRGLIQVWSRTLIPTAKEAPADAEAISHKLLARGGFIRRVSAGVYSYLPLGWRVLGKVAEIVRQEMNAAGASELLMPALAPVDLLKETGRAEDYGDLLFRFTDRHQRDTYLGPTHEEVITDLMRSAITSYRQLPLNLYQIQTKFRDEFRPRAGLLRGREFVMKDAYSFHMHIEGPGGLNDAYDAMYRAYENIFTRCGLDFTVVEAEAGPIGGSASHEFMVNTESGEDTILVCPKTGYAANVEKCEIGKRKEPGKGYFNGDPLGDLEEVHTPECPGIEDVCKLLKTKPRNMLKTVVFRAPELEKWVVAVVRGDHDVNEGKVRDLIGSRVELADAAAATKAGFAIGYVSPRAALKVENVIMLIDRDAAVGFDDEAGKSMYWVTGADKKDFHVKKFNWRRDMGAVLDDASRVKVADVRNAMAGDPSPRAGGAEGVQLEAKRGIEVGHIFKLGVKYSAAMKFEVLDDNQQRRPVIMGCYGIGVSRTVASCVEMSHDDNGIVWPAAIAPFHVIITPMDVDPTSKAMEVACRLSGALSEAGMDVLIDDREERPGVKFKDADLIGIPVRLTIGDKALAEDSVEFKQRTDAGKGSLVKIGDVVAKCAGALG